MDTLQLCLFFFFSEQANGEKMEHQPITPAEHTSHSISEATRWAITWTGGVQAIIAALAAIFGLWKLLIDEEKEEKKEEEKKKKEEDKKKKKKEEEDQQQAREIRDQLAALGKRLADLEVNEMVEKGKKRVEEEEMKAEREKNEKRKDAADKQHEIASAALGKRLDDIEEQQRLQIKEYSERVEELKSKHEIEMRLKDKEISDLSEKNATMLRLILVDHPGWAPGVTSGTTGG